MIKAIIFDCFGVLVTEGWLSFKEKHFGTAPKLFARASELNRQADAGLISRSDFIDEIAKMAGLEANKVVEALTHNAPNEPLFAYIRELKPLYKIGVLSNASANRLDMLFTPEQIALFDAAVLSVESGFVKPHPEAYKKIAAELGIATGEAVFIDDQERHCTGAREAGMPAIVYRDFSQAKAELKAVLADSKR